jgi:hypothetical protein
LLRRNQGRVRETVGLPDRRAEPGLGAGLRVRVFLAMVAVAISLERWCSL